MWRKQGKYLWGVVLHASQVALGKESTWHAVGARSMGLISGLGRFPWTKKWHSTPYSYLENSMDRGAWRVAKSRIQFSSHRAKDDMEQVILTELVILTPRPQILSWISNTFTYQVTEMEADYCPNFFPCSHSYV